MGHQALINAILDWHDELRRTRAGTEIIRAIEERIETETDPVIRWHLNGVLGTEHEAQGDHAAAQEVWRRDPRYEISDWHRDLVMSNQVARSLR